VKEALPGGIEIAQVDVWFQDEARVGQRGTLTRTWALKGTRPRLKRQQQFEYAYIFGSVCAKSDKAIGLIVPSVNTHAMQLHLDQIAAETPSGRHAILVLDRAAWHTTKRLNTHQKITLIYLPPASPELNPTEQVWRQLREDSLANRSFADYEDISVCACNAWNQFVGQPGAIKKLCTRSWANL